MNDSKPTYEELERRCRLARAQLETLYGEGTAARYRVIFEKSPLGMIRFSPDGTILDCNQRFVDLMGSSWEKLIGFNTARQSTPEMRRTIKKALAGDTAVYEDEYTSITGGKTLWLRVAFNPVNPGRSPTEVIATLEDVSERKAAEKALRKTESLLNEAQQIAHIASYERNLETGQGWWSDEHYRLLGYEPGEVAHSFELLLSHLHEMDRGRAEKILRTACERMTPFEYDCRFVRRDGEVRHAHHTGMGVLGEDGKSKWLRGTFQDITDRKLTEEVLKDSEERFRRMFEELPVGIAFTDVETSRLVKVNSGFCRIFGYTQKEIQSLSIDDLSYAEDMPENEALFRDALDGKTSRFRMEKQYVKKNGDLIWGNLTGALLYDIHGKPTYRIGILEDITQRKQMERELIEARESAEAASRAKSDFIANMSHELRTPLNAILGYGQILIRDETLSKTQRQNIAVMRTSGEHLLTLINDILDIAKIEAGKLKLEVGPTDLRALIANAAAMIRAKAFRKQIQLVETIDPVLPRFVEADEKRLRQVLLNLLSNAVKFTKKGSVTLRARPAGDRIAFSVSDTGVGIPENKITAVFGAFQQLAPIANKTEGTGLGLTISQNLVKLMGGRITVDSTVGRGSVFRFQIPLVDLDGKRAEDAVEGTHPAENETESGHAEPIGPILPPPATDIAALHALSRIGDLSAIVDYAAKMRETDPQTEAFRRTLEQYAAECDVTAIRKFIERFMGGEKCAKTSG